MKNLILTAIFIASLFAFSCKDKESDRFRFLTENVWVPDSLYANGVDATGPGGILESFLGDARFNKDGTGTFGSYEGTWRFSANETKIIIETDSLAIPVIADIVELTSTSLKLTAVLPNPSDFQNPFNIRMTFKAK